MCSIYISVKAARNNTHNKGALVAIAVFLNLLSVQDRKLKLYLKIWHSNAHHVDSAVCLG
jgi:hypothetical protein